MAAVQGKVTAYRIVFVMLTKESLDGASDSLNGDREVNDVWLVGAKLRHGCRELLLQDNCFCKAMAVSQAFIFNFKCYSIAYDTVLYFYCKIVSCFSFLFIITYQLLYNIAALMANKVSYIAFCRVPASNSGLSCFRVWVSECLTSGTHGRTLFAID